MRGQSGKCFCVRGVERGCTRWGHYSINTPSLTCPWLFIMSVSIDYNLLYFFFKHIFILIFFLTSEYQVIVSWIWGRKLIFPYPAFFLISPGWKSSLEMSEQYQWRQKSPDCQRRAWHGCGRYSVLRAGLLNNLGLLTFQKHLIHLALSKQLQDMTTCNDFHWVHFLLATFNLLILDPFSSLIFWLRLWSLTLGSGCFCFDDVWSGFYGSEWPGFSTTILFTFGL